MKPLAFAAALLAVLTFSAPQSQAGKISPSKAVAKLGGSYTGSGTFIDNRNAMTPYTYAFSGISAKAKIDKKKLTGSFSGSATVTSSYTMGGVVYPVGTAPVAISGSIVNVKISGSKAKATGMLTFSDGTTVDGTIVVSVKTGKGTFVVNVNEGGFVANFSLSKTK